SLLLLPTSPRGAPPETIDDPTDLTERVRVYQQFRQAGLFLARRAEAGLRSYPHLPAPYQPRPHPAPDPLHPPPLRSAFLRALARAPGEPEPTPIGEAPYTVAEALALVRQALEDLESVRFGHLVAPDASRQRYVATFLAILEIARLGLAQVTQTERFGEI